MNITVYMGSNPGKSESIKQAAHELGKFIGKNGHSLIYGGSDEGLMGIVADGVLESGGHIVGVFSKTLEGIEGIHPQLDKLIMTDDIRQRRAKMIALGDIFIALPGGPGTIEEISEVITLAKLDRLKGLCTLLNTDGYYDDLKAQYNKMEKMGFITSEERARILFIDSIDELKELI